MCFCYSSTFHADYLRLNSYMFFQPFMPFLFSVIGNEMEQMGIGPALIDRYPDTWKCGQLVSAEPQLC